MSAFPYPACINDAPVRIADGGVPFQPERPTLVLLHGALNDHRVWSPQAAGLAAHVNVLAPDLPGHGASAGPALHSVEDMADWLLALLDAANLPPVLLAGHSMGSLIALEAAARRPERMAGLALLGSTWPMRVAPSLLEMARDDEPAAIRLVAKWSHAAPTGGVLEEAIRLMDGIAAGGKHLLYTDLRACDSYANGEAAARALRCPVTLIGARADRMTPPKSAALLRAALPHARVVDVDGGHQMMAEQPEAVLAALLAFAGVR